MDQELATRSALTKPYLTFILVSLTGFLTACGNSSIEAVKNLPLQTDESYTVGQAYDNRAVCEDISWSNFDDDKGRNIVEYRCELKNFKEYSEKSLTLILGQIESQKQADLTKVSETIPALEEPINRLTDIINKIQAERETFVVSKNYDDLAFYLQTLNSPEENSTKQYTYISSRYDYIQRYIHSPAVGFYETTIKDMDFYLNYLKKNLNDLQAQLDKNRQSLLAINKEAEDKINSSKQTILYTGEHAFEIQQWSVKDSTPVFIGASLELTKSDEKESTELFDIATLERAILSNEVKDFASYSSYLF